MSKHFAHLHLHTEFSLLDGAIRINDLVRHTKEQGLKAVGITDHGNIFGAVKFFQKAKKEGIKPILGCEMYFTPDARVKDPKEKYYHLIVIVQNRIGYQNLCRLFAFAYNEGFYFKPRVDYETLKKYSEGLVVTTACVGGHIPTLLRHENIAEAKRRTDWFLDVFGPDRFFFEVAPADIEKQVVTNKLLLQYSAEWGVKLTAAGDAHYLLKEDNEAHEVLLSIQTKALLEDPDRFSFGDFKGYLKSTDEMLAAFPDHPEAIWNTGQIADSCDFDFETDKLFFPRYPVPENQTEETYFTQLCNEGLQRLADNTLFPAEQLEIYKKRLKFEIDIIVKMGYPGYFLVVSDFIQWAKKNDIPVGPGRGSGAGSLVAWALQITNVDPIKYELLFERFLNPERVSMPDFDIDFCVEGRERVINYVKEKYGEDCVCQIITFGTMMAKGVIKDVSRVLGFPFQDANALTNLVPDQLKITLHEAIEKEPKLREMIESDGEVKHLMDLCFKLEGITRHASKHAAGVVISPEPLRDVLPLYVPARSTDVVTQYAMTELETLGFLKMDFLGLTNLTVIDRTIKAIKKNHGVDIDLDHIPLDDQPALDVVRQGRTSGIFQFESEGIKEVLRKLQPDKFEDLIAVNALYRPGPLGSGMVDDFIERRHGRKKVTYLFPELEPVLSETHGIIVYQEQVMKIAATIAGYSLGAADILRKAMGKKKVDVMAEQKERFLAGATERGFDGKKAAELFDLMAYFAGYGFNKSHSTAYAMIAYHTAYLKAHYPNEFMAALITFETNNPDKFTFYLQEAHEMGLALQPPNVNASEIEFSAQPKGILFGLKGIKNVGHTALEEIVARRNEEPFTDLLDFCVRVDLRTVNKRVIESLICAGAFDTLPGNRAQQSLELDRIIAQANEIKEAKRTGQMGLFAATDEQPGTKQKPYAFQPQPEWAERVKLEKEKEVAGFYLSSHPLRTYSSILKWFSLPSLVEHEAKLKQPGMREPMVTCYGLLQNHKVINTRKGDRMAFAQIEDFSGRAEVIIFPRLYAKVSHWFDEHQVFVVQGTLDLATEGKCKIKANSFVPIELVLEEWNEMKKITLALPRQFDQKILSSVTQSMPRGTTPLSLKFQENGLVLVAHLKNRVKSSLEDLRTLEQLGIQVQLAL